MCTSDIARNFKKGFSNGIMNPKQGSVGTYSVGVR